MDKAEYREKLEEINNLAEAGKFAEAADAADQVDWRHVRSARTLCMIGEIYEANRRYDDSVRVLKYAYRRSASSKTVLYRLAEMDIKTGNFDEAKKFINEFERNSPADMSRYILKYKLLRAQKAPLDDQIEVLREYKDNEYTERWAYELAKLYKKNGQKERCIEECDDMILWFAEGKYVQKALELKKSLTDLTPAQEARYESMLEKQAAEKKRKAEQAAADKAVDASAENTAEEPAEESSLGAMETVEKTINAEEEEDEDISADASAEGASGNSGEKTRSVPKELDFSADLENADTDEEDEEAGEKERSRKDRKEKEASKPEKAVESISNKISRGFKNLFSGMKLEDDEEADDAEEVQGAEETPAKAEEVLTEGASEAEEAQVEGAPAEDTSESETEVIAAETVPEAEEILTEDTPVTEETEEETTEDASGTEEILTADETAKSEETAAASDAVPEAEEAVTAAEDNVKAEEPAASDAETEKKEEPAPAGDDSIDLGALFAETGSSLADEVASGEYVMADTLEEDKEEAEEEARRVREEKEREEQEKAGQQDAAAEDQTASPENGGENAEEQPEEKTDENLTGRETDESLGLTREFHFKEALEKLRGRGKKKDREEKSAWDIVNSSTEDDEEGGSEKTFANPDAEQEEKAPIESPELAAKRTVLEAAGKGDQIDEEADDLDADMKIVRKEDRGEADADLLAAFGEEDEEDIPEDGIPEDTSGTAEAADILRKEQEAAQNAQPAPSPDAAEEKESGPVLFSVVPVEGRPFTDEEKKIMSYFAEIPGIDMQVTAAVADIHNNAGDKTSRSGNVILMGRPGSGKTRLADGLIQLVALDMGLRAVKMARIVSDEFNTKDPAAIVKELSGGFLVIEGAGALSEESISRLDQAMEFRTDDLVVILEDEKADLSDLLEDHKEFAKKFTSRITVPVFTNDELVTFGKTYATEEGYKLDDLATLALYTMIGDNQKESVPVTVARVREMVDKAITRSNRRIFGKTTDRKEGLTILQEKDFNF